MTVDKLVDAAAAKDGSIDVYIITREVVFEHLGLTFEQISELIAKSAADRNLPTIWWDRRKS